MTARHQHQRTIARDSDAKLHNVLQPATKKKQLEMLAQTSKHCFKLVSYKCLGPNFYTDVDTYAKARPRQQYKKKMFEPNLPTFKAKMQSRARKINAFYN